jgi:hypothetical protein
MPETWTISVGSRVYGPYSIEQMHAFHAEGRLATHSLVAETSVPQVSPEPHRFGREPESSVTERSRFVIISDMKSGSISALEEEIFNLGPAYRFMPQSWVLTSEASLNTIRHALMQKMGKLDTIFVVDTIHDRAAWFNFGPEADTRVRRMWSRTPEGARKAS